MDTNSQISEQSSRIELSPDQMRTLGYRVIDMLVDHYANLPGTPPARRGTRADLEHKFREPIPENPTDSGLILDQVSKQVFSDTMHVNHPRFFGFIPGPGNFVGAMADALASGMNTFTGTWFAGSAAVEIELVTIDWLRQMCGLPDTAGGLFVSGGSVANLTALAAARFEILGSHSAQGIVYYSDQTHSSVERALRVLGIEEKNARKLPTDASLRLSIPDLIRAIAADRKSGAPPLCVIGNAGTTNTGAVDPLPQIAEICRTEKLWFHVDGAFGIPAVLTNKGKTLLEGIDRADSITIDPHKWLFQPFEIGCLLVRNSAILQRAFTVHPEYLNDVERGTEELNPCDFGIQLTRNFRALKLWMSIKTFGVAAFRKAIERSITMAEFAERMLRSTDGWEIATPAQMAIVSFRYAPGHLSPEAAEDLNSRLIEKMISDGYALLTSTILRSRTVLRLCTINPRTTEGDIAETIRRLDLQARAIAGTIHS